LCHGRDFPTKRAQEFPAVVNMGEHRVVIARCTGEVDWIALTAVILDRLFERKSLLKDLRDLGAEAGNVCSSAFLHAQYMVTTP
jgi:hypothetical protein